METAKIPDSVINFQKGMSICMNNKDLYRRVLGMFSKDTCFERAKAAFEKRDYKELFLHIHELKGSSGNVALTELYTECVKLVELLRHGVTDENEVKASFILVEKAHSRALDGIRELLGEQA